MDPGGRVAQPSPAGSSELVFGIRVKARMVLSLKVYVIAFSKFTNVLKNEFY